MTTTVKLEVLNDPERILRTINTKMRVNTHIIEQYKKNIVELEKEQELLKQRLLKIVEGEHESGT